MVAELSLFAVMSGSFQNTKPKVVIMESFSDTNKKRFEIYVKLVEYTKMLKQRQEIAAALEEKHKKFEQAERNVTEVMTTAAKLLAAGLDRKAIKYSSEHLANVQRVQVLLDKVKSMENRMADAGARSVAEETIANLKANLSEHEQSSCSLTLNRMKESCIQLNSSWDEITKVESKASRSIPFVVSSTLDSIVSSMEGGFE